MNTVLLITKRAASLNDEAPLSIKKRRDCYLIIYVVKCFKREQNQVDIIQQVGGGVVWVFPLFLYL